MTSVLRALRWPALLATALGCASAPVPSGRERATVHLGPEEREQAACLAGRYPTHLDAAAYANVRRDDVVAQSRGDWSTVSTARFVRERAEFDRRCEAWRRNELTISAALREYVSR